MPRVRDSRGAHALSAEFYTSADHWRREQEQIFATHWLCVGRSAAIDAPGKYLLRELCGESLILLRDESRSLRAHYNVCRHRGTRLLEAPCGIVKAIRCPYHAWTYDLSGSLIAAPHMEHAAGFDRSLYPLHPASIADWHGFLFVNLRGGSGTGPDEYLTPLDRRIEPWTVDRLTLVHEIEYEVQANWKLVCENFSECYHCPRVHPLLSCHTPFRSASNDLQSGALLGGPMDLEANSVSLTATGRACGPFLPRLDERQCRQVYFYSIFPNMFLSLHPDFVLCHRLEPLTPKKTRIVCQFLFAPEAVASADFQAAGAIELWDATNREDWHMCELAQQGITSRAYTPGPLSNLESITAAWDEHYLGLTAAESTETNPNGESRHGSSGW